jgi:hypothetical protein
MGGGCGQRKIHAHDLLGYGCIIKPQDAAGRDKRKKPGQTYLPDQCILTAIDGQSNSERDIEAVFKVMPFQTKTSVNADIIKTVNYSPVFTLWCI